MIDNLGSSILQKPGQMISFVNNVLEGYHQKDANMKERKKSAEPSCILGELSNIVKDEDSDDEVSAEGNNDDVELLYLALTFLSSLLEGKNSFHRYLSGTCKFLTLKFKFFKSTIHFMMVEHKSFSIQDSHILNLVFLVT